MKRFRAMPSPSMAVSITALFVALGGTGYAAFSLPKNSVGTTQLKNRAVTKAKLNVKGVTVPNAVHANNALTANTADTAIHATSADNATVAGSASPSGGAGGDLTGSYPNPSVGASAVTSAKLAAGAVGPREIGSSSLLAQAADGEGNNIQTGLCTLSASSSTETYCYVGTTFTPTVDVRCIASITTWVGLSGAPAGDGPVVRIAIKENSVNHDDGAFGGFLQVPGGSSTTTSTTISRTAVIPVPAGQTTQFGVAYIPQNGNWVSLGAYAIVGWICL